MLGWATGPPCATGLEASLLGIAFSFWEELYGRWKQPLPSREAMSPALSRSSNFILFSWTTDVKISMWKDHNRADLNRFQTVHTCSFYFPFFAFPFDGQDEFQKNRPLYLLMVGAKGSLAAYSPFESKDQSVQSGPAMVTLCFSTWHRHAIFGGSPAMGGRHLSNTDPPLFKCSFGRQF